MPQTEPPKQPGKRGPKPGKKPMRLPNEGNRLWHLYREMGDTGKAAFRLHVEGAGILWGTFLGHSRAKRMVSELPYWHLATYRRFFLQHVGADLFAEADAEHTADVADLLKRAGLALPAPATESGKGGRRG